MSQKTVLKKFSRIFHYVSQIKALLYVQHIFTLYNNYNQYSGYILHGEKRVVICICNMLHWLLPLMVGIWPACPFPIVYKLCNYKLCSYRYYKFICRWTIK